MTSTVHATGRASPFVLTYVAEILPQSESLELKICAIHLHSSLTAMNGVFSRGTDKGLNAIKTAYLKQGYLDLKMTVETKFDESAGVANYHIVVEEGKPYQMGEILIKNASEDEEKRIRGKWQMAQGAVFNVEYVKGFIKKMFDDRSGRTPRVRLQPDSSKQIANVLFTF